MPQELNLPEVFGVPNPELDKLYSATTANLRSLRGASAGFALQDSKLEIAQKAWALAIPLYEAIEKEALASEVNAAILGHGLDSALMNVIDDPFDPPGLLFQDAGEDAAEAPAPCCITRITFRNLLPVAVRVTASGNLGATAAEIIEVGKESTLRNADTSDNTTIPGGLGRCVTISVAVADAAGRWFELHSERVCCDTHAVGSIITDVDPPAPGESNLTIPRPLVEITEIDVLRPCTPSSSALAPDGRFGHDFREVPGIDIPDKGFFIGGYAAMLFVPPEECALLCFIQAVKRTVTIDGRPSATSHDWKLDLLPDQPRRPPCYAYQRDRPEGGRVMIDSPGILNPWGKIRLPDGGELKPRLGQIIEIFWEFRTWAVCLRPPALYGQFSWTLRVKVPVPTRRPARGAQIPGTEVDLSDPVFRPRDDMPQPDLDLFARLLR